MLVITLGLKDCVLWFVKLLECPLSVLGFLVCKSRLPLVAVYGFVPTLNVHIECQQVREAWRVITKKPCHTFGRLGVYCEPCTNCKVLNRKAICSIL